jgi:D-alanyl-D-alanine carboxypeptidase
MKECIGYDESALRRRVEAVTRASGLGRVELVVSTMEGANWELQCDRGNDCVTPGSGLPNRRVGCIVKSLTAVLVAHACFEKAISFKDSIGDLISDGCLDVAARRRFARIRIVNLLNHTHSIDDGAMAMLPYRPDGYIDGEELCSTLNRQPSLAPVGQYASYGNSGEWIAALILEQIYRQSYASLLQEKIFSPIAIPAWVNNEKLVELLSRARSATYPRENPIIDVCPASGSGLRLTVAGLSKLGIYLLAASTFNDKHGPSPLSGFIASLREKAFTPPGWQPKFRRICLGMNDYGGDWYGHNARLKGESAVLRFSPSRGVVISVTANQEVAAFLVLASVFGQSNPELSMQSAPRLLTDAECATVDLNNYLGTYENGALLLAITRAANNSLMVRFHRKQGSTADMLSTPTKRYLRPARDETFYTSPIEPIMLPFIQFLAPGADGKFKYIQNGRVLFARRDEASSLSTQGRFDSFGPYGRE